MVAAILLGLLLCSGLLVRADSASVSVNSEPVPPALLLANVYDDALDPTAYWVSEKLDGVRAYWDGEALS